MLNIFNENNITLKVTILGILSDLHVKQRKQTTNAQFGQLWFLAQLQN